MRSEVPAPPQALAPCDRRVEHVVVDACGDDDRAEQRDSCERDVLGFDTGSDAAQMVDSCDKVVVRPHLDVHHRIGNLIVSEVALLCVLRLGTASRDLDLPITQVVVQQADDDALVGYRVYAAQTSGGTPVILLCKRRFIAPNSTLAARRVSDYIWWERP